MVMRIRTAIRCVLPLVLVVPVQEEPARGEVVRFEASDGVRLVGDYWAPSTPASAAVILLHMYRSDRSTWQPLVPVLREAGVAVLTIDMRGHGASIGDTDQNFARQVLDRDPVLFNSMHRDVAAAFGFLSRRSEVDMARLAIVGASVGCSVAIDYARRDRSVDVVVCLTPGEKYLGVDSVKHMRRFGHRPILLLATEDERAAADKLANLSQGATAEIVGQGRVHGTRMFGAIEGIEGRIVSFIRKHVGAHSEVTVVADLEGDEYFAIGSKAHMELAPERVRRYSSVAEARSRGLKGPDSPHEGRIHDASPKPVP